MWFRLAARRRVVCACVCVRLESPAWNPFVNDSISSSSSSCERFNTATSHRPSSTCCTPRTQTHTQINPHNRQFMRAQSHTFCSARQCTRACVCRLQTALDLSGQPPPTPLAHTHTHESQTTTTTTTTTAGAHYSCKACCNPERPASARRALRLSAIMRAPCARRNVTAAYRTTSPPPPPSSSPSVSSSIRSWPSIISGLSCTNRRRPTHAQRSTCAPHTTTCERGADIKYFISHRTLRRQSFRVCVCLSARKN